MIILRVPATHVVAAVNVKPVGQPTVKEPVSLTTSMRHGLAMVTVMTVLTFLLTMVVTNALQAYRSI